MLCYAGIRTELRMGFINMKMEFGSWHVQI